MIQRVRLTVRGVVQGVGFRMYAQREARHLGLTGFVRNLPGGEVELVAEGEPDQVAAFLGAVSRHMTGYIGHEDVEDVAPAGLRGFSIRH